jgi:phosphonatase-like hydrolase
MAGTTVRDSNQVASAFIAALADQQVDISEEDLASVRGASKREAIARFIPAGADRSRRAAAAYASFRDRLREAYRAGAACAIEGAETAFRRLRAGGIRVALNTGFERDIADVLLTALRWTSGVVDAVICGDDVPRGRPAPFLIFRAMEATGVCSVHEVANVGDTVLDLQAGFNASVRWNIGVLTGAHTRPALARAPHTHLLASVADVPALWAARLP